MAWVELHKAACEFLSVFLGVGCGPVIDLRADGLVSASRVACRVFGD